MIFMGANEISVVLGICQRRARKSEKRRKSWRTFRNSSVRWPLNSCTKSIKAKCMRLDGFVQLMEIRMTRRGFDLKWNENYYAISLLPLPAKNFLAPKLLIEFHSITMEAIKWVLSNRIKTWFSRGNLSCEWTSSHEQQNGMQMSSDNDAAQIDL